MSPGKTDPCETEIPNVHEDISPGKNDPSFPKGVDVHAGIEDMPPGKTNPIETNFPKEIPDIHTGIEDISPGETDPGETNLPKDVDIHAGIYTSPGKLTVQTKDVKPSDVNVQQIGQDITGNAQQTGQDMSEDNTFQTGKDVKPSDAHHELKEGIGVSKYSTYLFISIHSSQG